MIKLKIIRPPMIGRLTEIVRPQRARNRQYTSPWWMPVAEAIERLKSSTFISLLNKNAKTATRTAIALIAITELIRTNRMLPQSRPRISERPSSIRPKPKKVSPRRNENKIARPTLVSSRDLSGGMRAIDAEAMIEKMTAPIAGFMPTMAEKIVPAIAACEMQVPMKGMRIPTMYTPRKPVLAPAIAPANITM